MSFSKTLYPLFSTGSTRKTGKHPDMAEKLFTGMSQNVSGIET